ncbi:MAG: hypothetical protein ABI425_00315 [Patescibacteria group bacterium]
MKRYFFLRLLLFFFVTSVFFSHVTVVSASTSVNDLDPTQDYSVHTAPIVSTEPQKVKQTENEKKTKTSKEVSSPLPTAQNNQATPIRSPFTQFVDALSSTINSVGHLLGQIGQGIASTVRISIPSILGYVTQHGSRITLGVAVFSFTTGAGVSIFNSELVIDTFRRTLTTATNLQVRLISVVAALVFSATTGSFWLVSYQQQIAFFEQLTGRKLNPIGQDLLFVGGVLGMYLLIMGSGPLLAFTKSAGTSILALLPGGKKIAKYFTTETKSAFIETEKECKETVSKCSSLFDKTIILAFNYLPGTMPDLGMDDAIIQFKNNLFKSPQLEKSK